MSGDYYLRLVDSSTLCPEDIACVYVALSYCWGTDLGHHNTTTLNIADRLNKGFQLNLQSATVQDAVVVSRNIGIRFLWVDSICIIQDNSGDKLIEISRMDQIYQHANLLISATRAAVANEGFLHDIDPEYLDFAELEFALPFRYCYQGENGRVVLERWFKDRGDLVPQPIHDRCWTMQEHLLSKRILAFGKTGLSWHCLCCSVFGTRERSVFTDKTEMLSSKSSMACRNVILTEGNYRATPSQGAKEQDVGSIHLGRFQQQYSRQEWCELRDNFSIRALTKVEDR